MNNWRWFAVKDTDPMLVDLYRRHYSSLKKPSSVYRQYGISGQGESLSLLTPAGDAGFVWVRNTSPRDDGQTGLNCSFFRNESNELSSSLILEAEEMALNKWSDTQRVFTYVDPTKINSEIPGYCFIRAKWKKVGVSKKGKLIFAKKLKGSEK